MLGADSELVLTALTKCKLVELSTKGNVEETSERQGGARMDVSKHIDATLN